MSKQNRKNLQMDEMRKVSNVRLATNEDANAEGLVTKIIDQGLLTSIVVDGDCQNEILQGHSRFAAIRIIKADYPKDYARLFSKGIKTIVMTGLTPLEKATLKCDHGEVRGLRDEHEVLASARMLFGASTKTEPITESQVVQALWNTMDAIKGVPAKKVEEFEKIDDRAERIKAQFDFRRGWIQNLHNVVRCPHIVYKVFEYVATGIKPRSWTTALPFIEKLTHGQVKGLYKAFQEDQEAKPDMVDQDTVGPLFSKKWTEIAEKVPTTKDERKKSHSSKDLVAVQERFGSKGIKYLLAKASDSTLKFTGAELTQLDSDAKTMEVMREYANDEYLAFKARSLIVQADAKKKYSEEVAANAASAKQEATVATA